jgi:hypothetical protein
MRRVIERVTCRRDQMSLRPQTRTKLLTSSQAASWICLDSVRTIRASFHVREPRPERSRPIRKMRTSLLAAFGSISMPWGQRTRVYMRITEAVPDDRENVAGHDVPQQLRMIRHFLVYHCRARGACLSVSPATTPLAAMTSAISIHCCAGGWMAARTAIAQTRWPMPNSFQKR